MTLRKLKCRFDSYREHKTSIHYKYRLDENTHIYDKIRYMNNYLVLIPLVYLGIYWLGAFFIVYHLLKYGITDRPKKIVAVFLAGSIMLSILNFMLFNQINWQKIFNPNTQQTLKNINK